MKSFKVLALIGLALVFVLDMAAIKPSPNEFINLQVLPKDISSKELQHIMVDEFQDGLGVGCGYCHAKKEGTLLLDYASDEKPEKEIARSMIRLTIEINKNYFNVDAPVMIGRDHLEVSCFTCHRGASRPEEE
jgi:hypothetical protein